MNELFIARRDFIKVGGGAVLASLLPNDASAAPAKRKVKPLTPLSLNRVSLKVGAGKPFQIIHISDTHFSFCDKRDNERKMKLAAARMFDMEQRRAEHYLDEAIRNATERNAMLVHTGDLIDFTSEANLDAVVEHFAGIDAFVCAGNHEFSQYVGEAREDAAYKAVSYDAVQAAFPNDLTFASKVVNGVNFIAFDNVYYNFTQSQFEAFEREVEKGLPIVVLCHVPLYSPGLFRRCLKRQRGRCAFLCGVPDSLMKGYQRGWAVQQKTDAVTAEFIKRLRSEPLLKAILCGHIHCTETDRFSQTAVTSVAGPNFIGRGQLIEIF